jgi:hypothetical protein
MKRESRREPTKAFPVSYCPEVLAKTQSLLAALADLDSGVAADLKTIRRSDLPEVLRKEVISTLQQRHIERRASILRQLEALHQRAVPA